MHAGGGEAEQNVTLGDVRARQQAGALDGADGEAGEVIVACLVEAGHLGRLAADQRGAGDAATLGDAGDDRRGFLRVELAGGEIVEEEQRLGALDDQVVDAHGDEVDADRVVNSGIDRDLELGADTVIGGDQQRIVIAGSLRVEDAAEAADVGIRARPAGRLDEWLDHVDETVAGVDIDACVGVAEGVFDAGLFGHRRIPVALGREDHIRAVAVNPESPAPADCRAFHVGYVAPAIPP